MNKYLNIIVSGFCLLLIVTYDFGYALIIPIIMIYSVMNSKSILLLLPMGVISTYIFNKELLICTIVIYVMIIIYLLLLEKRKNYVLDIIYVIAINMVIVMIKSTSIALNELIYPIIYSCSSSILYGLLKYLIKDNKSNFSYFEILAISISVIGATTIPFEYNIGFIIAVFYAMYFSYNTSILFSLVFSGGICIYLMLTNPVDYYVILPFISIIYNLNSIASGFITIILSGIICVIYPKYFGIALVIDGICIVFEFLKSGIVNTRIKKKEVLADGYTNSISILNKDILAFSTFLDLCAKDTEYAKEYYKKLEEGVELLIDNYCNKCVHKEKCHKNANEIKQEMSDLIINAKSVTYDVHDSKIFSICPYNVEMRKSAILVSDKLDLMKTKSKSKTIVSTLNGISNILRQFTIDNNIHKEIRYEYLFKLKKALSDNGYHITYFNATCLFEDDFCIEVGIRGCEYNDIKKDVEKIASKVLPCLSSIELNYTDKGKTYIKVIPKMNINIECASSSIASGVVSGDNVLVKENYDGKAIAVICDGMGKGYNANVTSETVIKMLEELMKSSLSTYAIIQILNTYCSIKDSLDNYCTLDYLELDKRSGKAVFYKMSAAPSYIYHKAQKKEKIDNERLPMGKELDIKTKSVDVESGDVIIMSSDGIFDNVVNDNDLEEYISTITHLSVEKIVYKIVSYVKNGTRLNDDDISLVVVKVM